MTKLLQDLIAIHQESEAAKGAPLVEAQTDGSFRDALDKWMDMENVHHWEGARGVSNFDKLLRVIGYRDMDAFLSDNQGAFEALFDFMDKANVHEWEQAIVDTLPDQEEDE